MANYTVYSDYGTCMFSYPQASQYKVPDLQRGSVKDKKVHVSRKVQL